MEGLPPDDPRDALPPKEAALVQSDLRALDAFAAALRLRREEDGALELESAEFRFETGGGAGEAGGGAPRDVTLKSDIPMMRVIAELMIAANGSVARKVHASFPNCAILRRHPPPRPESFEEFHQLLGMVAPASFALVGAEAGTMSNKLLARVLQRAKAECHPNILSLLKVGVNVLPSIELERQEKVFYVFRSLACV